MAMKMRLSGTGAPARRRAQRLGQCHRLSAKRRRSFDRFNAVAAADSAENYTDELMEEMNTASRRRSTPRTCGTSIQQDRAWPWTPCAVHGRRPGRWTSSPVARSAAWPWPGCCCPSPTCCCSTNRPTISTPNRSPGCSITWRDFPGCVILVTHDRYFLDQVTKWTLELDRGKGIPYEGNYSGWLEQKQKRRGPGEASEARPASAPSPANWSGCARAAKARQAKSKARLAAYEEMVASTRRNRAGAPRATPSDRTFRRGRAWAALVLEVKNGLRSPSATSCCSTTLTFRLPPNGIVGVIGPNGAGKSTLFKLITQQEEPDGGVGEASATRSSWPTSTRAATRSMAPRPSGRRSPAGWT